MATIRVFFIILLSLFCQPIFSQPLSKLTIVITGFPNIQGVARIAIFDAEKTYKNDNTAGALAIKTCAAIIKNLRASCTVKLPYGNYAVKAYHDVDNSGKLKTNLLGIPQESYGFSNNPQNKTGIRSWKNAYFSLNTPKNIQTIELVGNH